ncbi:hypothetical protein A7982_13015 [Minicystis rosea]|nr:hypothetical protein A7982_13015 [Minicystis rosea]
MGASVVLMLSAAGCGSTVIGGNLGGEGGDSSTGATTPPNPTTTGGWTTTTGGWTTTTSTSTSSTTTSSSGGFGGAPSVPTDVPPPGPPQAGDGTGSSTYAISRLFIGDTERNGTPSIQAWKQFGYNLDGQISTANSVGLCLPRKNASPHNVYPDGNNGIDNSFGKNIVPILLGLQSDVSVKVNESIALGRHTILLDLDALGAGSSYNPLVARAYGGAQTSGTPQWNGNDVWPVASISLAAPPALGSAKAKAPQSYLVGNTWVGRFAGEIRVPLSTGSFDIELPIKDPVITMVLDGAHQSATSGTIAGVMPTDAFVTVMKQVAGSFDPTLCSGPTIDSIVAQLEQASDILTDGSQDPSKVCDGISVGLGFDARRVNVGSVVTTPPPPNPCP